MSDTFYILILAVIFILGVTVLPQLFVRRAIPPVIRIFRHHNALGIKSAKTISELGLESPSMLGRMWKTRDYKPRALQLLMTANIVQMTEDGKLYLSEENLMATKWNKY